MSIKYRPEIDGLRALAVLVVVLYHAEFSLFGKTLFKGGFIGVDVFFVISGFLITSIIIRDLDRDSFSLKDFYLKRVRRILPVLFFVIVFTIPFFWATLLPRFMKGYLNSLLATLGFGSNIFFFLEDSYWGTSGAYKPFLHTWSLSLEEQFYIVFPLLLMLSFKYFRNYLGKILVGLFFISLLVSQYLSIKSPDASFFLLHTRAWELLAGAILAFYINSNVLKKLDSKSFLVYLGLAFIVLSSFLFNDSTLHPGLITLIPVIGTIFFIAWAKPERGIGRFASSKKIVHVGLISYSFYLWHQPVFVFFRLNDIFSTNFEKIIAIVISYGLSLLSYYLIETPARNRKKFSDFKVCSFVLCTGFFIVSYSLLGVKSGYSNRISSKFQSILKESEREKLYDTEEKYCYRRDTDKLCQFNIEKSEAIVVGFGDSYADVLGYQLMKTAIATKYGYIHNAQSGCPYIPLMQQLKGPQKHRKLRERCNNLRRKQAEFLEKLSRKGKPIYIVFSMGNHYDNEVEKGNYSIEGRKFKTALENAFNDYTKFENLNLIIISPLPNPKFHMRNQISKIAIKSVTGEPNLESWDLHSSYSVEANKEKMVRDITLNFKSEKVRTVDPYKIFCDKLKDICRSHDGKNIFYVDRGHVTKLGAELIVNQVFKRIEELRK